MRGVALTFCLLASVAAVSAQSPFGFRGHRYDPFSDFDPFANARSYSRYAHALEEPFLPPCPKYRPIEVGDWHEVATPSGGAYQLHTKLPWVRPSDRQAQISSDGQSIEIIALRPVPTRGRVRAPECLPRDARLSRDGRFEILETSVQMPPGDMSRATVRQLRHGLEITVPRQNVVPHGMPHAHVQQVQQAPSLESTEFQAEFKNRMSSFQVEQKGGVEKETMDKTRQTAGTESMTESTTESTAPKASKESKVLLPPSDGIQVLEEDYDYPEKDPDASEGWIDVRGEFQSY